jgi:ATP-dependent protease ClpP protease subunit
VGKIFFPIVGEINKEKEKKLKEVLKIIGPGDELVSYISSFGGEIRSMSLITETISKLPIKTVAYAGKMVYSSAAIIICSFQERIAFNDSKFIIHLSKPRKGKMKTEDFDKFDLEFLEFMANKMKKVSLEELIFIAKRGKVFGAERALEIGLVDKVIDKPTSAKKFKKTYLT